LGAHNQANKAEAYAKFVAIGPHKMS